MLICNKFILISVCQIILPMVCLNIDSHLFINVYDGLDVADNFMPET